MPTVQRMTLISRPHALFWAMGGCPWPCLISLGRCCSRFTFNGLYILLVGGVLGYRRASETIAHWQGKA